MHEAIENCRTREENLVREVGRSTADFRVYAGRFPAVARAKLVGLHVLVAIVADVGGRHDLVGGDRTRR